MEDMKKYAEVDLLDKALNGEKCQYCNSTNTAWAELLECEVSFWCNRCSESFVVEFCFLSDEKQAVISKAKP